MKKFKKIEKRIKSIINNSKNPISSNDIGRKINVSPILVENILENLEKIGIVSHE